MECSGSERLKSRLKAKESAGHLRPSELQLLTRAHRLARLNIQCEDSDAAAYGRSVSPVGHSIYDEEKIKRFASPSDRFRVAGHQVPFDRYQFLNLAMIIFINDSMKLFSIVFNFQFKETKFPVSVYS